MQRLEVSGAVRPIYGSLGIKRLNQSFGTRNMQRRRTAAIEALLHLFFTSTVVSATPGRFITVSIVEEAGRDPAAVWATIDKRKISYSYLV